MEKFGIGQPVRRVEDERFITGNGRYIDDIHLPAECHGVVVRSPHAHARILGIDAADAAGADGVLAVLTADEYTADGLGTLSCLGIIETTGDFHRPPRPALAHGRVRHVGDPVAFVVAETRHQALAAAEMVFVDYEVLPAVVDSSEAFENSDALVWEEFGTNRCFNFRMGDGDATDRAFAEAERVVSLELTNNRLVQNAVEPRGALGQANGEDGSMTLYLSAQSLFAQRGDIAKAVFGMEPEQLRVVAPDVGGGFGSKNFVYPEYVLVLWASKRLGRPVRWISERTEAFLTDVHARDHVTRAELALDADNRFKALRVRTLANMGAYLSAMAPVIPTMASWPVQGGAYVIPHLSFDVDAVFTNTVPVDAYRGAGRPEAAYIIERLVEVAAREIGIEANELRRANFISDFPHTTALGRTVDCGDFGGNLERARKAAGADNFEARRAEAQRRGRLRGLAYASYLEITLGPPTESSELRFEDDGSVTMLVGTHSNGQGHDTAYRQIVNDVLGIEFDKLRFVQGDTGLIASGGGHGGSRSIGLGGLAMKTAAETTREKGRLLAAHVLDAAPEDVEFADGAYTVRGTNRHIGLLELAEDIRNRDDLPDGLDTNLSTKSSAEREGFNFPNGCHAAEVEIDPDTGRTELVAYTIVDDFGRIVNPLLAAGQAMGGTVQGIGQALLEHTVFDPETGQLLSGSLMDYTLPRADDIPPLHVELNEDAPTATNPLGVKGAGEAGCTGAPPAIANAVMDALSVLGIRHLDMPYTSERVWRAIREARKDAAA